MPVRVMESGACDSLVRKEVEMGKTTALLVDPHPVVLTGLKTILNDLEEFEVVGEARHGPEALDLAESLQPHMVVTDIFMPYETGMEILANMRAAAPSACIVLFTVAYNKVYWDESFQAGADAFLTKESRIIRMAEVFKAVRRGEIGWYRGRPKSPLSCTGLCLEELYPWSGVRPLSPREREVFRLLAEGRSIREIAGHLGTSRKTVESQKYRLMEKLEAHNMADILRIAIERRVISY